MYSIVKLISFRWINYPNTVLLRSFHKSLITSFINSKHRNLCKSNSYSIYNNQKINILKIKTPFRLCIGVAQTNN